MKKTVLAVTLLAALAAPAFASGSSMPRPKAPSKPGAPSSEAVVRLPRLIADGSPIPWPTILTKPGNPGAVGSLKLSADGSPIPWPTIVTKPPKG